MNTFYSLSDYTQNDTESIVVNGEEEKEVALPGFRFRPTDEELVGFYLRRKVDKKPISIELIKQIDIYKFDPWDLPKPVTTGGEKEGYFFCKRGRKYRNSIRPNRVTGSGFWKATGIDKPVYSNGGGVDCIGLKKTLVYYRGSAGKGTKTDWMMHEFRLPANLHNHANNNTNPKCSLLEAEVWTLCRIFKRDLTNRKYTSDWRELSTKRNPINRSSKTTTTTTTTTTCNSSNIMISFDAPHLLQQDHHDHKSCVTVDHEIISTAERISATNHQLSSSINAAHQAPPYMASSSNNIWNNNNSIPYNNNIDLFSHGEVDMDELISVMEFACSNP